MLILLAIAAFVALTAVIRFALSRCTDPAIVGHRDAGINRLAARRRKHNREMKQARARHAKRMAQYRRA